MTEWQSIETAPKDGTRILLYWPNYSYSGGDGEPRTEFGFWKENSRIHQSYFSDNDELDDYGLAEDIHAPSYWMPVPRPPT